MIFISYFPNGGSYLMIVPTQFKYGGYNNTNGYTIARYHDPSPTCFSITMVKNKNELFCYSYCVLFSKIIHTVFACVILSHYSKLKKKGFIYFLLAWAHVKLKIGNKRLFLAYIGLKIQVNNNTVILRVYVL